MNAAPPTFQRYPLVMNHPQYQPAVVSQWVWDRDPATGLQLSTGRHVPEHGRAAQWPAVTVERADDEEYYRAKGYEASGGDAAAFAQQHAAPQPAGYVSNEYPKWIDDGTRTPVRRSDKGEVLGGGELVGCTVHSREEEAAVRARLAAKVGAILDVAPVPEAGRMFYDADGLHGGSPSAEELAEFRAWKARQEAAEAASSADPDPPKAKGAAKRPRAPYKARTRPADEA